MISAINVRKRIADRDIVAIDAIDFPVGSVTSIVGPSGAGKTTLLRLLALIDEPDSGEITVGNWRRVYPEDTTHTTNVAPWPTITAVFQDLWLWDHLDLETNIRLPTRKNRNRQADERFERLILDLDIKDLIHRFPHQVSGGERQRAAIARALMQRPQALLLDEPTSASDVEHSHRLAEMLRALLATEQLTIVVVTHHLGFASRISDRVVFLDRGAVLQAGSVDLLRTPTDDRVKRFVSVL